MRERLIGASVLVIIAVILVPWLVSRAQRPHEIVRRLPIPANATDAGAPYELPLPSSGPGPVATGARPALAAGTGAATGATAPAPASAAGWSIQVASFSDRKAAQGLAGRLARAGFNVFLAPHTVDKIVYYRVRVGPYAAAASARAAAPRVAAVSGTRVVVRAPGSDG